MTALSITAANVVLASGAPLADQVAGEAFIAGAGVYLNSADGKWYKAKCNGTADQVGATGLGLALFTADVAGARGDVATVDGQCIVSIGAGAAGSPYYPGATAGALNPFADLVTGNKATCIGFGVGSNKLRLARLYDSGAVLP